MNENHNILLQQAIEELGNSKSINIHGKNYKQVSTRINLFRKFFSDASLETEITYSDEFRVIIKATITIDSKVIATGFAEETRSNNDNSINSTSMIEVCETSAIGRALANFGLGGDSEYASANEVVNAINQQNHHNNSYQKNFNQNQSTQSQIPNNTGSNLNELTQLGITIKQNGNYQIAEGNVFANKDILKGKFNFKWDSVNRQWFRQVNMQGAA